MSQIDEIDFCITVKVQNNPVGYDGAIIDARIRLEDEAKAKLKSLLLSEAVEIWPGAGKRWDAIPVEAIEKLFND